MRINVSECAWEAGCLQDYSMKLKYYVYLKISSLIDIDIENIEAGQSVPIGELVLPEGVRIAALAKGEVASISVIRVSTPEEELEEDMEMLAEDDEAEDSQEGGDSENG